MEHETTPPAQTFDLTLSVIGLGLYAVDDASGQVHFLMPSSLPEDDGTDAGGDDTEHHREGADHRRHAHEPHFAQLIYDRAHLVAGSPERSGALVLEPLNGFALELDPLKLPPTAGPASPPPAATFPGEVLDLGAIVERTVDRALTGPTPGSDVNARVTVGAGALGCIEGGAEWQITVGRTSVKRRMAWLVRWVVRDITADSLQLTLAELNAPGSRGRALPPFHPVMRSFQGESRRGVDLWVYHEPARQIPPLDGPPLEVPRGDPPPHVSLAFRLLRDVDDPTWEDPKFERVSDDLQDGTCAPQRPDEPSAEVWDAHPTEKAALLARRREGGGSSCVPFMARVG